MRDYIPVFLPMINKEDFYSILKNKYLHRMNKETDTSSNGISQETIDFLQAWEGVLSASLTDQKTNFSEWHLWSVERKKEFNIKGVLLFEQREQFSNSEIRFPLFSKIVQFAEVGNSLELSLNEAYAIKSFNQWLVNEFKHSMLNVTDTFGSTEFIYCEFLSRIVNRLRLSPELYVQAKEYFLTEDLYLRHQQYYLEKLESYNECYILCFDVHLYPCLIDGNSYQKIFETHKKTIERVTSFLESKKNDITTFFKFEPGKQKTLNLHCVLMVFNVKNFDENTLISELEFELNKNSSIFNPFTIHNWNNVVRANFDKNAVGVIKYTTNSNKSMQACWKWVFSPMLVSHQVLEFKNTSIPADINVISTNSPLPTYFDTQSVLNNKNMSYRADSTKNNKVFTDLRHLSKEVKLYLQAVKLSYVQLSNDHVRMNPELLYLIEFFCETLKVSSPKLLLRSHTVVPSDVILIKDDKMFTRLGVQWFTLHEQLSKTPFFSLTEIKEKFFSQNIKLFDIFYGELRQLQNKGFDSFTDYQILNEALTKLKKDLEDTEQKVKSLTYFSARYEQSIKYVNYLFKKDVYVLRLHLRFYNSDRTEFSKQEQSKALTQILRLAKSSKPFSWLRGYIQRWDEKCEPVNFISFGVELNKDNNTPSSYLYCDLTLFFDALQCAGEENLVKKVNTYFSEKLQVFKPKLGENNEPTEMMVDVQIQPIFYDEYHMISDILQIETLNTELHRSFKSGYVLYLSFLDLFIDLGEQSSTHKIKRFTTGHKPKSKHRVKNKDDI